MHSARLAAIAVAFLLGAALIGCGHKSGREVSGTAAYNLHVTNYDEHTLTVYVDGGKLGSMPGFEEDDEYSDAWDVAPERFYWIQPGHHEVEFRFGNDLQSRISQGTHEFTTDSRVELVANEP